MLSLFLALNLAAASPAVKVSLKTDRAGDSAYMHTFSIRNGSKSPLGMVVLKLDKSILFGNITSTAVDSGWKGIVRDEHEGEGTLLTFRPAKRPFHSFPIPVGGSQKFHFLTSAIDTLPMQLSYSISDTSGAWHDGKVVAESAPDSLKSRPHK